MQRRQFQVASVSSLGLLIVAAHRQAWALSLSDLSDKDATAGIRAALEKGALAAVGLLGKTIDASSAGGPVTGKVTSLSLASGEPQLTIEAADGRTISGITIGQIESVR